MIYLVLAILSSACISLLMRISGSYSKNQVSLLAFNYIICILLSLFYSKGLSFNLTNGLKISILLGGINGLFFLLGFVLLQKNIMKNGVILSSTFQKLGIVVPTLLTIFIFKEIPSVQQCVGLILAIICIFILQFQKGEDKAENVFLLLTLLLVSGSADAMSKVFERIGDATYQNEFLLIIFLFAFVLCVLYALIRKEKVCKEDAFFGCIIGIPNYYSARFLLKSLYSLPAILVYPVYSVMTILVVSAFGILLFKEKLKKKQVFALVGILCALALLNG